MYDLLMHFILKFVIFLGEVNIWLGASKVLPNLMGTIGIALLTILIPLAIVILGDILQKKREKKADLTVLDLHVILDSVLKFKLLLLCTSIIFLPLFFWELQIGIIRILIIYLWIAGIVLLGEIIFSMYSWSKGNVFDFRFEYLKQLKQSKDLSLVWRSVWQTENINALNEEGFFEIFSSQIDDFLSNAEKKMENFSFISTLLEDFKLFLENRSNLILSRGTPPFLKILEWHLKAWQKKREYLCEKDEQHTWFEYERILVTLDAIFQFIEEVSLKDKNTQGFSSYMFFDYLKKHVNTYKKETVKKSSNNKPRFYREYLLGSFYSVFFKNAPYQHNIWENFPKEWLVTKSKLGNEENLLSRISLKKFDQWTLDRIQTNREEFDKKLEDISRNLFPEVDPIIWSRVLLFVYSGYNPKNRTRSVIEKPWNFGFIGRTLSGWGKNLEQQFEKIREKQEENTLKLALFVFRDTFTKGNLEKHIEELKELESEYNSNSEKEKRRIELLRIFEKMLSLIH